MSVQCHSCIGGTNVGEDIRKLDYGQHIVSGTPGRVFGQSASLWVDMNVLAWMMCARHDQTTQPSNPVH